MQIRPATRDDLPAILAIYNDVVATSTAIWTEQPATLAERTRWYDERVDAGFPVLVAAEADATFGFASFGSFRAAPGYRQTVEHTVHVHRDARRRGAGRALVAALLALAREQGRHVVVGAIDAENEGSLRLHESLGFEPVARMPEVGRKFGRWLDLVLVQCRVGR